ncbi:MAG: HNH endonuclease [Acidimicrobiales bacterium]
MGVGRKKRFLTERQRRRRGSQKGHWRGRRTRHKAGYVTVHAPGHPRARKGSPYVFEHILVAEELLGRYLMNGESVHHVNGVRDDNRPENLELWTRPQPSGVPVSDAIDWARQIHDRYVGPGAPPTMLTLPPEHSWRWCLENPTTPNDRRSARLPGRAQAGHSYLPGRGGRSHRGAGRWWGSAGLHRGERACRDGLLRIRLVSGDGGQDDVADDPPGSPSSLPRTRAGGARLVPGRALS